jgi:peptidyl-prolyl cis-trans isomerase SurA
VKVYKICVASLFAILLFSASAVAEVTDRIVAVVNDEVITLTELNRAFEPYAKNIQASYQGNDVDKVLQQNKMLF